MRGRGPNRRLSKDLLVEAGVRAVRARFRSEQRLEEVLAVRLREITSAADVVYEELHGEAPHPPISSGTIYRLWENREDYLKDVFEAMFSPPDPPEIARMLLGRSEEPWQTVLSDWVNADHEHAAQLGPVFLLGFVAAGAGDVVARDALAEVYAKFDQVIVPILRDFLVEHSLAVTGLANSSDPDGVATLATMLSAITEGWYLRDMVRPEPEESTPWATQAVLLVEAATTNGPTDSRGGRPLGVAAADRLSNSSGPLPDRG